MIREYLLSELFHTLLGEMPIRKVIVVVVRSSSFFLKVEKTFLQH
jgi:hypothetical protein